MSKKLYEDKYQVLLIMFETSFIKDDCRITYINRQFIANELNFNYRKTRYLQMKLINDGLIKKVKTQSGVGYIITNEGMKIINKIKGDDNL